MKQLLLLLSLALGGAFLVACEEPPEEDAGPDPVEDAGDPPPDAGDPGPFCPERLVFTSLADSLASVGWTGVTHNQSISEGTTFTVSVDQCDLDCRLCAFSGPIQDPEVNILRRCLVDSSVPCESALDCPFDTCDTVQTPGGPINLCSRDLATPCADNSDCGPSACVDFTGPNLPSPIQQTAFTAVFTPEPDTLPIAGRIDLETGTVTFDSFPFAIFGAPFTEPGYPPECNGDPTPNDGVKEGTCEASPWGPTNETKLGEPCDQHGASGLTGLPGTYSLDCSVPQRFGFDMSPQTFGTNTAPRWTLSGGDGPQDQPTCADGPCWCGVCDNDLTKACHFNSDCPGSFCAGGDTNPEVYPQPLNSACSDECVWDPDELLGSCNRIVGPPVDGGPPPTIPTFCVPRGEDAEISLNGSSQILTERRSYSVVLAGLSCASPGGQVFTNTALGLPGPLLSLYRYRIELE